MKTLLNVSAGLGYVFSVGLWIQGGPAAALVPVLLSSLCLGLGRLVHTGERLVRLIGALPAAKRPE
jgi:hypothetical protein